MAIRVKDIPRTLDFYVAKLGISEMMRLDRDGRALASLSAHDRHPISSKCSLRGPASARPSARQCGYNHICLEVCGYRSLALRELEAAGVPLHPREADGRDGNWQAWIEDPDGHRIELMQMMPDSLQAKAIARMAAGG